MKLHLGLERTQVELMELRATLQRADEALAQAERCANVNQCVTYLRAARDEAQDAINEIRELLG